MTLRQKIIQKVKNYVKQLCPISYLKIEEKQKPIISNKSSLLINFIFLIFVSLITSIIMDQAIKNKIIELQHEVVYLRNEIPMLYTKLLKNEFEIFISDLKSTQITPAQQHLNLDEPAPNENLQELRKSFADLTESTTDCIIKKSKNLLHYFQNF